jgi:hypothetical protein
MAFISLKSLILRYNAGSEICHDIGNVAERNSKLMPIFPRLD